MKNIVWILLLLCVNVLAEYSVVIKEEIIHEWFETDGEVEPMYSSKLSAQTSGIVSFLAVDVDDYVKKGDVLLKISPIAQAARRDQARAKLDLAKFQEREAKRVYERILPIAEEGLAKEEEVSAAKTAYEVSKKESLALKQILILKEEDVSYTVVKAPYDGVIQKRDVEFSEIVHEGTPLFKLFKRKDYRVLTHIPESLYQEILERKQVVIRIKEREYRIDFDLVTFYPSSKNYSYAIRIEVPQEIENEFYAGNYVKVKFSTGEHNGIFLNEKYIHQKSEINGVYVVDEYNNRHFRFIRLGDKEGNGYEVLSGLSSGEKILNYVK